MSKHARLTSWVISSHNWDSPAGTPSLSQREPRTARARALKTSVPLRRELPSEQATSLVRRQRQPAEQILARRVPPRARAPPVLAPRVRLSLREQRRDGRGMFRCVGQGRPGAKTQRGGYPTPGSKVQLATEKNEQKSPGAPAKSPAPEGRYRA